MQISLNEMLFTLSSAINLVTPSLYNHHQQTAYLAFRIAEKVGLPDYKAHRVLLAGMLHDIGMLSSQSQETFISELGHAHAFCGARLLEEYDAFKPIAYIIRFHHVNWERGQGARFMGEALLLESHILHIADYMCTVLIRNRNILLQAPEIISRIRSDGDLLYHPDVLNAVQELGTIEYIWLELTDKEPLKYLSHQLHIQDRWLAIDEAESIARIFARVIDFRSRFTATHSVGVAVTAEKIGELVGLSQMECKMLKIAGYLHDLGKLAIDETIINKPGKLDEMEMRIVRSHAFYTYQLLGLIHGFEAISKWASFHHERLDGSGYPFHLKAPDIPFGARIMAVVDTFTAMTEQRPYRDRMMRADVIKELHKMAKAGLFSSEIVDIVVNHYDLLSGKQNQAQVLAMQEYAAFYTATF